MRLKEYIPEYEKLSGKKVSPKITRTLERLESVCMKFEESGRKDADRNRPPVDDDTLQTWGRCIFGNDIEQIEFFVDLVKDCYMAGYGGGRV